MAYILVQSFLNTAVQVNLTVNLTDTISSVKEQMYTAEGVDPAIMDLVYNGAIMANASTLASYGISSLDYIRTHNQIARLATKEDKQLAKLALATVDRAASGRPYVLDITELPNPYNGNDVDPDENPNTGGLIEGRPWA